MISCDMEMEAKETPSSRKLLITAIESKLDKTINQNLKNSKIRYYNLRIRNESFMFIFPLITVYYLWALNGAPLGYPVFVLCHGDPATLELHSQPLHVLQKIIDAGTR